MARLLIRSAEYKKPSPNKPFRLYLIRGSQIITSSGGWLFITVSAPEVLTTGSAWLGLPTGGGPQHGVSSIIDQRRRA